VIDFARTTTAAIHPAECGSTLSKLPPTVSIRDCQTLLMRATPACSRRRFLAASAAAASSAALLRSAAQASDARPALRFRYIVGSCMYGYAPLEQIVPEVPKTGAAHLDIWPKVHGNQREQLDEMGVEAFAALLAEHDVQLGCITQYKLGPFGLQPELPLAKRLGCQTIVTGARGPRGLRGGELKAAVGKFIEQMKPHLEAAAEHNVTIAIENHGNNLMESAEALRYLVELRPNPHLAVALAPYHLPQDSARLAELVRDLGDGIAMFYAWQHGNGCMRAQPKESELLQMPGRGPLDFGPIVEALAEIDYRGWTEIFMHPFPRGVPILEPISAVTEEINRAREYLATL
jgi:sugar phosphate isomerase/epimerase